MKTVRFNSHQLVLLYWAIDQNRQGKLYLGERQMSQFFMNWHNWQICQNIIQFLIFTDEFYLTTFLNFNNIVLSKLMFDRSVKRRVHEKLFFNNHATKQASTKDSSSLRSVSYCFGNRYGRNFCHSTFLVN